jgi:hypothetical protein
MIDQRPCWYYGVAGAAGGAGGGGGAPWCIALQLVHSVPNSAISSTRPVNFLFIAVVFTIRSSIESNCFNNLASDFLPKEIPRPDA